MKGWIRSVQVADVKQLTIATVVWRPSLPLGSASVAVVTRLGMSFHAAREYSQYMVEGGRHFPIKGKH